MFPKKLWDRKGRVLSKLEEPQSYKVETEQEIILRRNCRDLLKTKESFEPKPEEELDTCTPVHPELSTQDNLPGQSPVEPLIPPHIPSQHHCNHRHHHTKQDRILIEQEPVVELLNQQDIRIMLPNRQA